VLSLTIPSVRWVCPILSSPRLVTCGVPLTEGELREAQEGLSDAVTPFTRMAVILCRVIGRKAGDDSSRFTGDLATVNALVVAAHLSINDVATLACWDVKEDKTSLGMPVKEFVETALKVAGKSVVSAVIVL
jgi:hypothetical protein